MSATVEAEWDEREQAMMLALAQYESQCCPNCAGYLPETTDPQAEDGFRSVGQRCHRCTAIGLEADRLHGNPQPQALLFQTTKRE
jgi:hypothetical protein